MARHVFTREECRRGGQARAALPDFPDMCRKGFLACVEKHPFYARHYLRAVINDYNVQKARALVEMVRAGRRY